MNLRRIEAQMHRLQMLINIGLLCYELSTRRLWVSEQFLNGTSAHRRPFQCHRSGYELYRYVCEVLLGFRVLIWEWRQLLFELLIQKQYRTIFERDQHATGSCRPGVVLVHFSLFMGDRYIHKHRHDYATATQAWAWSTSVLDRRTERRNCDCNSKNKRQTSHRPTQRHLATVRALCTLKIRRVTNSFVGSNGCCFGWQHVL